MPFGLRINTLVNRSDPDIVAQLARLPSTDISDVTYGAGTIDKRIHPVFTPVPRMAGPAVTISVPSASLNMLKAGLAQTRPGDVVVVNGRGNTDSTFIGGNILRGLLHRGVAAFIIDGAVRDVSEIRADGLPVYARGIATGRGPSGPDVGEVNFPIACGGVVVNPGDIVVADEDGIVVIPSEIAEETIAAAQDLHAKHAAVQPQLHDGQITGIADIERHLRDIGCEFLETGKATVGA